MFQEILTFWFNEIDPKMWWSGGKELDNLIRQRFAFFLESAAKAELYSWRSCAEGRLAEIIVLDQFSRNIYRNTPQSFEQDATALVLAQEAVTAGAHKALPPLERCFLLLPYMHSESKHIHVQAEALYREFALRENYEFELQHKAIIDRFGRYPHRNGILGRIPTLEEIEFLKQPGSTF